MRDARHETEKLREKFSPCPNSHSEPSSPKPRLAEHFPLNLSRTGRGTYRQGDLPTYIRRKKGLSGSIRELATAREKQSGDAPLSRYGRTRGTWSAIEPSTLGTVTAASTWKVRRRKASQQCEVPLPGRNDRRDEWKYVHVSGVGAREPQLRSPLGQITLAQGMPETVLAGVARDAPPQAARESWFFLDSENTGLCHDPQKITHAKAYRNTQRKFRAQNMHSRYRGPTNNGKMNCKRALACRLTLPVKLPGQDDHVVDPYSQCQERNNLRVCRARQTQTQKCIEMKALFPWLFCQKNSHNAKKSSPKKMTTEGAAFVRRKNKK